MTQRNPLNERYNSDKPKGQTRKSAASAKPKRKAADTVYISDSKKASGGKKKELTKLEKKEQNKLRNERENKIFAAATALTRKQPGYRRYKMIWWIILAFAILATIASWLFQLKQTNFGQAPMVVSLVLAYGAIIVALILDFRKVRPVRKEMRQRAATMSEKQLDAIIAEEVLRNRKKKQVKSKETQAEQDADKLEDQDTSKSDLETEETSTSEAPKKDMSRINSYRRGSTK
ncbi:MAG: hypothetical protein Q4E22_02545 [Coriobacteriia bacterium]|nr:hypothetical protein [Coriobacteriia bacterium]